MASGSINNKQILNGVISKGSGSADHNRLFNREAEDQHPIEAITGLRKELDGKLDSETALPLIDEALKSKAKGLYYDAKKEFARKSFWYLTAEIDPITKQGTKESIISGPYDLGQGGGGGGGGVTTVTLKQVWWPSVVVVGNTVTISVNWSSTIGEDKEPTGNGTLYLLVNNRQVEVKANQAQGLVEFDISQHIIAGPNTVQVRVLDAYGTTGVTVGTINAVILEITSNFNDSQNFSNSINYTYIPWGDIEKTVYFIVDGEEKGTQVVLSSGEQQSFRITGLNHGSHTLQVYFTAFIGGQVVRSNELFYDLVYYEEGNTTPIIVSTFNKFEQEQYIPFNIYYRVFVYGKNNFDVEYYEDGEKLGKTLNINTDTQAWEYKNDVPGNYCLQIKCGDTYKTFNVHIVESQVKVRPVTTDLALYLTSQGRSNNESPEDRATWSYLNTLDPDNPFEISCNMTNFNWSSNGWVKDNDGNTVLRLSGDARVEIPFKPFLENFRSAGKTIELEFATSTVMNYSSTIISCLDKESSIFFEHNETFVEEDTRINIFDVTLNTTILEASGLTGKHVFNYTENGWMLDSSQIVDLATYGISLRKRQINEGSSDEYIMVGDNIIISSDTKARGFYVTPQLAGYRSQQSVISTQYKEDEHVRIAFVIEKSRPGDPTATRIIWMYVNGIASGAVRYPDDDSFRQLDADIIKLGSNDAVLDIYNIRIYENDLTNRQIVNNWIADTQNAALKATRYYRNDNFNQQSVIDIANLPLNLPYVIWDCNPMPASKGDKQKGNGVYVDPANKDRNFKAENAEYNVQGTSSAVYPVKNIRFRPGKATAWYDDNLEPITKWPITYPDGIGANYFTFKVDYASSEGANNVELVRIYNDASKAYGIKNPPQRLDDRVRVGIDGFPVVAFHQDTEGKLKFMTKANFNNDKANPEVFGFTGTWETHTDEHGKTVRDRWAGDESWEITNNSADEAKFKVPVTKANFSKAFEIRYPDEDGYDFMDKLGPMTAWVASTNRETATGIPFAEPITLTWTYIEAAEDGSYTTKTETETFTADTTAYRLAKFKAELKDWFDEKSTIFYYIFTHLFLMVDSRAKNAFPTYFASRVPGDGGDRWFWLPYDMDTAIGINNEGKLVFDYNLEDTDVVNNADVYNGQDSVMWTNLREMYAGEIKQMYAGLRSAGLLSFEKVESIFEEHQNKWSENIFNEDAKIKYVDPLKDGDNYLEMLQGAKAEQRKWWLYNRFKYFDSKYNAGDARADTILFRAYVAKNVKKPNITITPYADVYATVTWTNGVAGTTSKRATRNEPIILENPMKTEEAMTDQEIHIFSASQLKSIGDISGFRPDTVRIGNAVKLQELIVGSDAITEAIPCTAHLTEDHEIETIVTDSLLNTSRVKTYYRKSTNPIEEKIGIGGYLIDIDGYSYTRVVDPDPDPAAAGYYEVDYLGQDAGAYTNPNLKELTLGSNTLLKKLDAKNCINLAQSIDASKCLNIEEIYFEGTKITGIQLPNGGNLKRLHLPDTLTRLTIRNQPLLTDLQLAGKSQIEALWLENIPSSSIDAYDLVSHIKTNAEVRLMGINETYDTGTDLENVQRIERFYRLLDTMHGIDSEGEMTPTAQVSGVINIPRISYADYVRLSAWYDEVKIIAGEIWCEALFINDGVEYYRRNVLQGNTIVAPADPEKAMSVSTIYTFDHWYYVEKGKEKVWTPEVPFLTDLTIYAYYTETVRPYTVTFETLTQEISVVNPVVIVGYGSPVAIPVFVPDPEDPDWPEGVQFEHWATASGDIWSFDTLISGDLTLYAQWTDATHPWVESADEVSYNKIRFTLRDNFGLYAYAVTQTTELPTDWHIIAGSPLVHTQEYTITSAGDYYIWVKDSAGKTNQASLTKKTAYNLILDLAPGSAITLTDATGPVTYPYALSGTVLSISCSIDSHYNTPRLFINDVARELEVNDYPVSADTTFKVTCIPNKYTVSFDLGSVPGSTPIPSQQVTYLTTAEEPVPQYVPGLIVDSWYLDAEKTQKWNFETDVVLGDTVLYAEWVQYSKPTYLHITIPEISLDDPERAEKLHVALNYSQAIADSVIINWGDGSADETSGISGGTIINLVHDYERTGDFIISIQGPRGAAIGSYSLGGGLAAPLLECFVSYDEHYQKVVDCHYITSVEFAADITHQSIAQYLLRGASITDLCLSPYIKELKLGMYAYCNCLENITIPSSVTIIRDQVFVLCENLETVSIPDTLLEINNNVFERCTNLTTVNINSETSALRHIGINAFRNTGLTHFKIPKSVRTFGWSDGTLEIGRAGVFDYCPNLRTAGPYDSVDHLGNLVDVEYPWVDIIDYFGWNTLEEVIFSPNITSIGKSAFYGTNLAGVIDLEDKTSLTTISDYAFYSEEFNSLITEVKLPQSLVTLGAQVFEACTRLLRLEIPLSVRNIGRAICYRCWSLAEIIIRTRYLDSGMVSDTSDGWFREATDIEAPNPPIKIPAVIFADPTSVYGPEWNYWGTIDDEPIYLAYQSL